MCIYSLILFASMIFFIKELVLVWEVQKECSMTYRHTERNHSIVNHIGFSTIDFVLVLFTKSKSIKCLKIIMPQL